jgi:hypothetical protein
MEQLVFVDPDIAFSVDFAAQNERERDITTEAL